MLVIRAKRRISVVHPLLVLPELMRIESFLEQSPVFQTSRVARRMEASLNALLKHEGLTFSESLMLAAIFLEKKRVRPSELAAHLRDDARECEPHRLVAGGEAARAPPHRSGGCPRLSAGTGTRWQAPGRTGRGNSRSHADAVRRGDRRGEAWRQCCVRWTLSSSSAPGSLRDDLDEDAIGQRCAAEDMDDAVAGEAAQHGRAEASADGASGFGGADDFVG